MSLATLTDVPAGRASPAQVRYARRLVVEPGTILELLVLTAEGDHCAGVDLASGALVRTWSRQSLTLPPAPPLRSYDVVSVVIDGDTDGVPDPAQPEGLALRAAPELVGRLTGRRAERLLRPLLHPRGQPLLGTYAPAIRFWERRPDHPSISLVEPEGAVLLRRHGDYLGCQFAWQGLEREMPCLDRRLAALLDRSGRTRLSGRRGDRLVVAFTPPIDGHCHKVIEAVLRRP